MNLSKKYKLYICRISKKNGEVLGRILIKTCANKFRANFVKSSLERTVEVLNKIGDYEFKVIIE